MTDDAAVVVLDTLTIRRCLNPDGTDSIDLHVEGDSGLTMHLGMLALTHDTLIRASMTDDLDSDE
jgi:hypothetical protein